ncbi:hypothetical protein ACF061_04060 [Streptomyces sp. NPDC015220]|uniref:hypothetical protein n=1 Tax=Streptomyces sp. NPDC015220 TaxID=3364947 RepID=UPI0036FB1C26
MRKFQKAAVVVAMLGSVGFIGAGAAQAHGGDEPALKVDSHQSNSCGNDTVQGVLNISRVNVQVLDILSNQPVDQGVSTACSNGFALGG